MTSSIEFEYDNDEENEIYKLTIEYEYERYYPQTYEQPSEGGFSGITEITLNEYWLYSVGNDNIKAAVVLTPEIKLILEKKFESILKSNQRLFVRIVEKCAADYFDSLNDDGD